jgi:hypothetical protein
MSILDVELRDKLFSTHDKNRNNWFLKKKPNLSWYVDSLMISIRKRNENDKHDSSVKFWKGDRK